MARRDGQKRDETSRGADGRKNALGSDQRTVRIDGDETYYWLAGIPSAGAGIAQIDLSSALRIFHEIRRCRTESHVASIRTHRRRVAFVVGRGAIGRNGHQRRARLATCRSAFASIPEEDLCALILKRSVGDVAPVEAHCRRLFHHCDILGDSAGGRGTWLRGRADTERFAIAQSASTARG